MTHPAAVTDATFATEVLAADVPVLVDFWATWCPPCKQIAPHVEQIADEYAGRIKVVTVDVDANPLVAGQYGVMSIPTLMVFQSGQVSERSVGYQPKNKLVAMLGAAATA